MTSYVAKYENVFNGDVEREIGMYSRQAMIVGMNLKAGEEKTVTIPLNFRSFAYYSVPKKEWIIENGTFEILVGASSRNILLKDKIEINLPYREQISQN